MGCDDRQANRVKEWKMIKTKSKAKKAKTGSVFRTCAACKTKAACAKAQRCKAKY